MSVMALQTTISTGTGRISDLGTVAYGREGSRGVGLYKTTLAHRQRPLDKFDRGHHGRIFRVKPWARITSVRSDTASITSITVNSWVANSSRSG
jgi:hypothetical protein